MTQKQVEITRRQDIVVATVSTNPYGDLEFSDTEGGSYKIGAKRVSYFNDIIIPQQAVRLNYTTAYGKEYIYNAIPAEQIVKAKEPDPSTMKATIIPEKGKIIPKTELQMGKYKADPAKTESIERQVTLKTAVELAVADKIKVDEILSYATVFGMYLSGEFSESKSEILAKYVAKYGRKE